MGAPSQRKRAVVALPYLLTVATGTLAQTAVTSIAALRDPLRKGAGDVLLFALFLCLTSASFARTFLTRPGDASDWEAAGGSGAIEEGRTCVPCRSPKPERVHHCSVCEACVARFDHHCVRPIASPPPSVAPALTSIFYRCGSATASAR